MTRPPTDPAPPDRSEATRVYTDGACSGKPGPGGWAWATVDGRQDSGGDPDTTNQRMELTAVLEALRAIDGPVVGLLGLDLCGQLFQRPLVRGMVGAKLANSQKKAVANRDLWEPLVSIFGDRGDELAFVWVKAIPATP